MKSRSLTEEFRKQTQIPNENFKILMKRCEQKKWENIQDGQTFPDSLKKTRNCINRDINLFHNDNYNKKSTSRPCFLYLIKFMYK